MAERECPTCGASLSDNDKFEGPEEPETGWEYYICTQCGAVLRPDEVEPETEVEDSDTSGQDEFVGTVVQSTNPVVLDNGTTSIECQGLDDVRLGEEVTVTGIRKTVIRDGTELAIMANARRQ